MRSLLSRAASKNFELDAGRVRLILGEWHKRLLIKEAVGCVGGGKDVPAGQVPVEGEKLVMRSDLVFGALSHVSNRYQLCQLASKATRKLHKPNTRLQDTTNDVLIRFRSNHPGGRPVDKMKAEEPVVQRRAA